MKKVPARTSARDGTEPERLNRLETQADLVRFVFRRFAKGLYATAVVALLPAVAEMFGDKTPSMVVLGLGCAAILALLGLLADVVAYDPDRTAEDS